MAVLNTNVNATVSTAEELDNIIKGLGDSIDNMLKIIEKAQERGIQTDWAREFVADLIRFREGQFGEAIKNMRFQSANLKSTASASINLNKGTM